MLVIFFVSELCTAFKTFELLRVSEIPNPESKIITNILTNQNNFCLFVCLFICFCLSFNNFDWLFWDQIFVNGFGESLNNVIKLKVLAYNGSNIFLIEILLVSLYFSSIFLLSREMQLNEINQALSHGLRTHDG